MNYPPFDTPDRAKYIKSLLKEKGIKQVELSRATGQNEPYISRLLNGKEPISNVMFSAMYYYEKSRTHHPAPKP